MFAVFEFLVDFVCYYLVKILYERFYEIWLESINIFFRRLLRPFMHYLRTASIIKFINFRRLPENIAINSASSCRIITNILQINLTALYYFLAINLTQTMHLLQVLKLVSLIWNPFWSYCKRRCYVFCLKLHHLLLFERALKWLERQLWFCVRYFVQVVSGLMELLVRNNHNIWCWGWHWASLLLNLGNVVHFYVFEIIKCSC